jgi:hypothetical protein
MLYRHIFRLHSVQSVQTFTSLSVPKHLLPRRYHMSHSELFNICLDYQAAKIYELQADIYAAI